MLLKCNAMFYKKKIRIVNLVFVEYSLLLMYTNTKIIEIKETYPIFRIILKTKRIVFKDRHKVWSWVHFC